MPDRPKVRFQTKRDTGVYAVRGRSRFASGTRLLIRRDCASEPATATREGLRPGPRESFKRDTVDLAPGVIEGMCGVFSQ